MRLAYAFLANYAELLPDGKFTAVGAGVDGFIVEQLPEVVNGFTLVGHFHFVHEECDTEYAFGMSVTKPDGTELTFEGASRMTPLRDEFFPERPGGLSVVVPFVSWTLSQLGIYQINLQVDGVTLGSISLGVTQRENPRGDGG
jgi:hypothetical protein